MKKIILLGYMGSGKTTIGRLLGSEINTQFVDLDQLIEDRAGLTIPDIFEKQGELYFRKLEHQVFKEVLNSKENSVLSIGGGTPCYANNHELLNSDNVISFYLKGSPEELYYRLVDEQNTRPLIAKVNSAELKDYIAIHLFERSFYYTKASYTITIDGKTPEEIVSEIQNLLV